MMELTFTHDVAQLPQMLQFNYDELKNALAEYLAKFKGLVVTEDAIKDAESIRARLNKTRDAIKAARISIKRDAFDAFEGKCKELERMCDDTAQGIKEQLDAYETERKSRKYDLLTATMYADLDAAFADNPELRKADGWSIFQQEVFARKKGSWFNAGVTVEAAKAELAEKVEAVKRDWATLEGLLANETTDTHAVAFNSFLRDFSLANAASAITAYKDQQRIIAERRAREEAERAEQLKRVAELKQAKIDEQVKREAEAANKEAVALMADPAQMSYCLRVTGTKVQLVALRNWMVQNGVKFEKVVA